MTPQAQRIAIAEACGIRWTLAEDGWWDGPNGKTAGVSYETMLRRLPDYLNDLNAMHEAKEVLGLPSETNDGPCEAFCTALCAVCGYNPNERAKFAWALIHATAAQRAEAFLRTFGKWKDDEDTVAP